MACREPASEYGYDPSVLALHRHPLFVVGYAHGGEAYLHAQLVALEKEVFHNVAGAVGSGAEQYAQRQGVVYVGLAYVEYVGFVACQNVGKGRGHARTVVARYVDED